MSLSFLSSSWSELIIYLHQVEFIDEMHGLAEEDIRLWRNLIIFQFKFSNLDWTELILSEETKERQAS